jgi:hypothetical protein
MMLSKHFARTQLRYFSMFISCHGSLRTNMCFNLIAPDIFSLKSPSPDILCPLRHFPAEYCKHAA